ncbi:hypothetical protein CLOSTMETH_03018 [[Clostridium] methylpentosum DSM 5476]|uniref:Uncharacterized protein n=1 Tax=[Clostridium] methylpentosum DSM 5476 TaxID=537013 RepID=C0EGM5_9FIRM|nr:hypothetical protein CLOSTMETH_03018 [[Clostridium] methylpentosum DSM 5476]
MGYQLLCKTICFLGGYNLYFSELQRATKTDQQVKPPIYMQ